MKQQQKPSTTRTEYVERRVSSDVALLLVSQSKGIVVAYCHRHHDPNAPIVRKKDRLYWWWMIRSFIRRMVPPPLLLYCRVPSVHPSINRNHCHPKQSLVAVAHYQYYSDDHWSLHFWSSSHPIGLDHLVSPGRCSIIAIPPAWTFWSLVGSLFWLLLRECLWSSSTRVTK